MAQVTSQVTIHVTDINDNKPQFYLCTAPPCNFTGPIDVNVLGQIEEHASARTPVANLSIVAYDPDKVSVWGLWWLFIFYFYLAFVSNALGGITGWTPIV